MNPSPELRARVLGAIKREPSPPIDVVSRRRVLAIALGFVPVVAIFQIVGGVVLGERPMGYVAFIAIGWTILALAATWGAIARGRSMLGRPRAWLVVVAIVTPLLLLGVAAAAAAMWPQTLESPCTPLNHVGCFAIATLMASAPLVAFAFARRHTDPVHPHITGAALGAAAGAWGALAVGAHCPFTNPVHLALGHTLPILLLAVLGALIGGRGVAIQAQTK